LIFSYNFFFFASRKLINYQLSRRFATARVFSNRLDFIWLNGIRDSFGALRPLFACSMLVTPQMPALAAFLDCDFLRAAEVLDDPSSSPTQRTLAVLARYFTWTCDVRTTLSRLDALAHGNPAHPAPRVALYLVRASSLGVRPTESDCEFLSSVHAAADGPSPSLVFTGEVGTDAYLRALVCLLLQRHKDALHILTSVPKFETLDVVSTPSMVLAAAAEAQQGLGEIKRANELVSAAIGKIATFAPCSPSTPNSDDSFVVSPFLCPYLHSCRIALYIQMKRWKAADADCRAVEGFLGSGYADPIFLFHRSLILEHFGQFAPAVEAVTKAIACSPALPFLFIRRARLYERMRQPSEAADDYSRAIEVDPKSALAYNNRGVLFVSLGRFDEALRDYDAALSLDPQFVDAWSNRALLFRVTQDHVRAVADVTHAIEVEPDNIEWYKQRAELQMDVGNYEAAIRDLSIAIQMVSEQKMVGPVRNLYERRAEAFSAAGQTESAQNDLEAARHLYSCESCPHLDTCKFLKVEF
jgi:tetratricopeptide (TPR) repeat protein